MTTQQKTASVETVMAYDELCAAKAGHNEGMARHIPIDDLMQQQNRAIRAALFMLSRGDKAGAKRVLESVKV
jgi:hypothetical protein